MDPGTFTFEEFSLDRGDRRLRRAGEPPGATGVLILNLGFAAMWLFSAGLFWRAARRAL